MKIQFNCNNFDQEMQARQEYAGQDVDCPECGTSVRIPPESSSDESEWRFSWRTRRLGFV